MALSAIIKTPVLGRVRSAMSSGAHGAVGRPRSTSHAEIEAAAFALFAAKGFEETTVEDIADEVGIGRRTLFRYFRSKNDIPWGQFDAGLTGFRAHLFSVGDEVPVLDAVHGAVVEFNRLDPDAVPQHRQRMALIMNTPSLQAHSALRYEDWRAVICEYVAHRYGLEPWDLLPRTVGHLSLALSLSAYEQWLLDDDSDLLELLRATRPVLERYVRGD